MAKPNRTEISASSEKLYATREDFRKILDEDLDRLYQLSFLLTGDRQSAENCFVAGIEACGNGIEAGVLVRERLQEDIDAEQHLIDRAGRKNLVINQ